MKAVNFIRMEDGTREEYEFLDRMEDEYKAGLPDRIMDSLRKLEHSLSGYRISRLEHSLQGATRAFRAGEFYDPSYPKKSTGS
jgi:predicted HD phosphohydrolase